MILYRLLVEIFKLLKANPLVEPNPRPMRSLDHPTVSVKSSRKPIKWRTVVATLLVLSPFMAGMVGEYVRSQKIQEIERQREQEAASRPKDPRTFEQIMDQVDQMTLQATASSLNQDVAQGFKSPALAQSEMDLLRAKLQHERLERQAIFSGKYVPTLTR
jgi:hypothetical protein